ncbi:MAG: hypothetical protein K6D59_03875 [Bacteroidales bacterium]|nr:hypothetical protein [Bacteroidales bacterium]
MKLYIESHLAGKYEKGEKLQELRPEFIDAYIENTKVFEKINFDPQVIADLVVEFPSEENRIKAMMERYQVTRGQTLFAQTLPLCETPLYFSKEEYYHQIERLKTLRQILQEIRDVLE